jgi:hypothetical protein
VDVLGSDFNKGGKLMRKIDWVRWAVIVSLACAVGATAPAADNTATPRQLVETYDSLADAILAAQKTEWNLVHSILATTYSHAEGTAKAALARLEAGDSASAEIEALATLVAQIGNEGDAKVAAIRKRLVEGGHHHQAAGEQQGIYDPGFVIVTREAKKQFIDSSKSIARMAKSADATALKSAWDKVAQDFEKLHEGTH